MQYCLSAKLTATAKSLRLARVYCNFVVIPHEITDRESRKNFSLQRDMLIATHKLLATLLTDTEPIKNLIDNLILHRITRNLP